MSIPFAWWLVHGALSAEAADRPPTASAGPSAAPSSATPRTERSRPSSSSKKVTKPKPKPAPSAERTGPGTTAKPAPGGSPPTSTSPRAAGGDARPEVSRPRPSTVSPTEPRPVAPAADSTFDRSRPAATDRPGLRPIEPAVNRPTAPVHRAASPAEVRTTARVVVPARPVPVAVNVAPVRTRTVPLSRSYDHRFARPDPYVVIVHPVRPAPRVVWYRPYWTHWYVHPYWRWTHATLAIALLTYDPDPWHDYWLPPVRAGWVWVPGHFGAWGWIPGHWEPVGPSPAAYGVNWVYVPGYWVGGMYVDGFWRRADRAGWLWVDGYYLDDGSFVRGYWAPAGVAPKSDYVWEGGFWDGEYWVEGFWRPERRAGYRWVNSWLDDNGIYHGGYWEPLEERPGMVWIPGWFTGEKWEEGYWVSEHEYNATNVQDWEPDEGWDAQAPAGRSMLDTDEPPPAIPVSP
jgi:hypothetical protein